MAEKKDSKENKELNIIHNIKLILLGEVATGKTCLINTFLGKDFNSGEKSTINPVLNFKEFNINNNNLKVSLWDTMGQERFRAVTANFIKDSNVVIFVYDITKKETFLELNYWVDTVKREMGDEPVILGIAANKIDLLNEVKDEDDNLVGKEEGEEYAHNIGAIFSETSAKINVGFGSLVNKILEKLILNKEMMEKTKEFQENEQKFNLVNPSKKKEKCMK